MNNIDRFIHRLSVYGNINEELVSALSEELVEETYSKNEFLLREGQVCSKTYFIVEGLVRIFFYADGKEITNWIHSEHDIFTAFYSFHRKKPSLVNLQALEDTTLLTISHDALHSLFDRFHQMERIGRLFIEDQFAILDEISKRFSILSAKEKYDTLLLINPTLFQRAKLGHIASILGISQETLSRIRSEK